MVRCIYPKRVYFLNKLTFRNMHRRSAIPVHTASPGSMEGVEMGFINNLLDADSSNRSER